MLSPSSRDFGELPIPPVHAFGTQRPPRRPPPAAVTEEVGCESWFAVRSCERTLTVATAASPSGTLQMNVVFFKLHKVGGSTFEAALRRSLEKSGGIRGAACLNHNDSLPLLRALLASMLHSRGGSIEQDAAPVTPLHLHNSLRAASIQPGSVCQLHAALPVRTAVLMRQPVERIISKYYYHREACPSFKMTRKLGMHGWQCGASVLPLWEWLNRSAYYVRRSADSGQWDVLESGHKGLIECEQLMLLGGGRTATALARGKATLDAMDVVS